MSLGPTDRAALAATLAGMLLLEEGDPAALELLIGGMERAELEMLAVRLVWCYARLAQAPASMLRAELHKLEAAA
jgi:hypothetical protein